MQILEKVHLSSDDAIVGVLDSAEVATSESAMGECLNKAGALAGALDGTNWEIFDAIAGLADERKTAANAIRSAVEQALRWDEHVKSLAGVLKEAQSNAVRLLTEVKKPKTDYHLGLPQPTTTPVTKPGRKVVDQGTEQFQDIDDAQAKLEQLTKLTAERRHLRMTITWRIEEETNAS